MKLSWFSIRWVAVALTILGGVITPEHAMAQRPVGTDVSSYQGSGINWTTVKNDGVSFAWTKATEGTYYHDADLSVNEANAPAAGVPMGAYHFARPGSDPNITGATSADTEASYYWSYTSSYVKAGGSHLVPMLDWEDTNATVANGFTVTQLSSWMNEWCNDVSNYARASGVMARPVVYTGGWYSQPSGTYPGLNTSVTVWPGWISDYPSCTAGQCGTTPSVYQNNSPSGTYPWTSSTWSFWQWGDTNWSGGDSDVFNGTMAQFLSEFVVVSEGPVFANQPASIAVPKGSNATFSVTTTNTGITYQWAFNGTNISGATASSYPITNVQTNKVGAYTVSLTDTAGRTPSTLAMLSIQEPWTNATGSIIAPTNMVNWWTADWSYLDIYGGATALPRTNLAFASGKCKSAFKFDGLTTMLTTGLADLPVPWTACLWVNRQNTSQNSAGLLEDGTNSLKLEQYNLTRKVGVSVLGVADSVFSSGYSVPVNTWTHLAFVGTSANTSLYVNGVLNGTVTNVIPLPRNYIGGGYYSGSGEYLDLMLGSLDELMTFNRALSATEISAIYSSGATGLVRGPGISSESWLTSTHFMLNLIGLPGKTLTVAWSTNLITWTNVTAPFANPTGNFSLTDLGAKTPRRYYRVSQQ